MKKIIQISAVLLLCEAGNAWSQIQYSVTDLGTLPGMVSSSADGINDSGQVVGCTQTGVSLRSMPLSGKAVAGC